MKRKRIVCNHDHCFNEAELCLQEQGKKRGEKLCWKHAPKWARDGDRNSKVRVTIV